MGEKRIEVVTLGVDDIKTTFGNPRKISKKKLGELRESIEAYGDFGLFLVNENNELIAGNQRFAVIREDFPEAKLLCKRLIGYSKSELKAINIKDNTHAGEWDLDILADWTADLNLDLGLDIQEKNPDERKDSLMEPIQYEKYNYIMIMCKDELSFNQLQERLGIDKDRKIKINEKKKIKARACWYDEVEGKKI